MSDQIIVLKYKWKTKWDKVECGFTKFFGVKWGYFHDRI